VKQISATRPLRTQGFTLIELMIVIAIIGIVAAIAVPSYNAQMQKTRRADAKSCLVDAAQRQEDFYYTNNVYTATLTNLGFAAGTVNCGDDANYTLAVTINGTGSTYLLTATRANAQTGDTLCGNFTLSSTGVKGETGTLTAADCW
jgi:type IV pilus assembly protein PilE